MLYLYDASRFDLLVNMNMFGWWLTATEDLDPFRLGNKPQASPVDAFNNTQVDHVNFHGYAWEKTSSLAFKYERWTSSPPGPLSPYSLNSAFTLAIPDKVMVLARPIQSTVPSYITLQNVVYGGMGSVFQIAESASGRDSSGLLGVDALWVLSPTTFDMRMVKVDFRRANKRAIQVTFRNYHGLITPYGNSKTCIFSGGDFNARVSKGFLPIEIPNMVVEGFRDYTGWYNAYQYGWYYLVPWDMNSYDSFKQTVLQDIIPYFDSEVKKELNFFTRDFPFPENRRSPIHIVVQPPGTGNKFAQRAFRVREQLMERVEQFFDYRYLGLREYDDRRRFATSTQSAIDSARSFSGNGVALLRESFELREGVTSLIKLLQGRVNPKTISSLWLSMRYGLRLTALDTIEIAKAIVDISNKRYYRGYAVVRGRSEESRCQVYYRPTKENIFTQVIALLREWDLAPSLTMLWDFIPYSFVVDWFVDVEGFLQALDSRIYMRSMEVVSALYTTKMEIPVDISILGLIGSIKVSRFRRATYDEPIPPTLSLSGSLPSFKNIIDGASLIINRL